jgi:HEAT repeat protein
MTSPKIPDQKQLRKWLELLTGPGWKGREARERAADEMRAIGAGGLFPRLRPMLHDPDVEVRCQASRAILLIDAKEGMELLLPLLDDPDDAMRWDICGLMHDFGDERAVEGLIERMKNDPDPQIRGTAAYALGGIGSPRAIPALTETLNNDHEVDQLGYTPSFCAKGAIDEIQGKNKEA